MYNKFSKCPPWDSGHAFTRLIDVGVVAGSLRDIHNAVVKCLSLSTVAAYTRVLGVVTGEGPEDWSQASLEAMQLGLLYLSICHNGCYWKHLTQHG
jgi:hypothetical protein